jgi:gamma-glutamyltranspeptidase/glutathione hydrolase
MADTLPDGIGGWRAGRSRKIFLAPDGTPLREGDRLVQRDLARTLSADRRTGPRGFYEGPVAEKLAKAVTTPAAS